jgi:hypothetical protein
MHTEWNGCRVCPVPVKGEEAFSRDPTVDLVETVIETYFLVHPPLHPRIGL